ncbi:isochorismate synthase [Algoriphagus kandeliae]|uniref:Isochorismate synthase n=1 Tax=Algoriphagus kandeliae TaxID=2562278 RepID=A0A4Y9QNA0_9BACT|nr:chorismate-binding protein [Algoriphagus kandeliae]TFV94121.1 isochorismate synthase [Algoriphagus kandeliae]
MIESLEAKSLSQYETLQRILSAGFQFGGSFALWRKPHSSELELTFDDQKEVRRVDLNLEESKAGFIIHPFEDQEDQKAFFIEAKEYFKIPLEQKDEPIQLPDWMHQFSQTLDKKEIVQAFNLENPQTSSSEHDGTSKSNFLDLVEKSISAIQEGYLEKVVPARTKILPIPEDFDLAKSLLSLLKSYPNSFVNFFHLPGIGTWMGASPEILIETKEDWFYTMSLAGTQAAKGENPLKAAAWTQKEIEEQALVSRYIVDCFKKIRLREYEEHGPKTVLAGNLLHLRSDFRVNMKETNFPQLGSVMLQLLHPTSAVCGMPRKEAHDFLKNYEGFDRKFFAGFIGPVNIEKKTSIFVNLRTASFSDQFITLYAGAGVTEDSDPEKEWEETELKCNIIGKFIQKPQL